MNLYRVDWIDHAHGQCFEWEGTKRDAKLTKKRILGQYDKNVFVPEVSVAEVEVPTKKEDLLKWLNTHVTRNNG